MTPSPGIPGQDTVASLRARLARLGARGRGAPAPARGATPPTCARSSSRSARRAQELRRSYKATVLALANAVEARDAYTGRHAQRVAAYGLRIAHAAGVAVDPQVEFGFLLHDVGKVAVPDAILFKPGPLTARGARADDARIPTIGSEILRHVDFLDDAKTVVRHHHERWDGNGLPGRAGGRGDPVHARVFALADALDALTTDRPYREASSWAEARETLREDAGTHFDPAIVAAYDTMPDDAFAAHPRGHRMTPTILDRRRRPPHPQADHHDAAGRRGLRPAGGRRRARGDRDGDRPAGPTSSSSTTTCRGSTASRPAAGCARTP